MLDILCVGDSKIDIFLQIPETNPHFGLDKTQNKLFVSFGEKSISRNIFLEWAEMPPMRPSECPGLA